MKVLIAGDFCPQNRVAKAFENAEFELVLGDVKRVLQTVDYSIVNFECPIVKGCAVPINKWGPNLKCSIKGMEAVKYAGFNCVTLANNHFLDYGSEGVKDTLEVCSKLGIDSVGGGKNITEASKVLYKEIKGEKIAIINCCEHEFSIASDSTPGSNPLEPIKQYYTIKEAKKNADYVLVIVHGGHELYQLPSPRMIETYRFFIDAGADAVVNHHQHCYSGYEIYAGKPIFYGLGNFCFDKNRKECGVWNKGYMVVITFDDVLSFEIKPYNQCVESPSVSIIDDRSEFEHDLIQLNKIIESHELLSKAIENYYHDCNIGTKIIFEPYNSRVLNKLYSMHLLPSFLSKSKCKQLRNMIECEAHLEKTNYFFKTVK